MKSKSTITVRSKDNLSTVTKHLFIAHTARQQFALSTVFEKDSEFNMFLKQHKLQEHVEAGLDSFGPYNSILYFVRISDNWLTSTPNTAGIHLGILNKIDKLTEELIHLK